MSPSSTWLREKLPSKSVVIPSLVPFFTMFTPSKGISVPLLYTVPVSCSWAVSIKEKNVKRKMNDLAENDRYEQKDGMKARIKKDVKLLLTILNGLDVNANIVINLI